ncbi:hypothetical protein QIS74_11281 [Colletotrichum tabaci]|uniref:Secreted protein n=1 Tax=Colletotrichum tabaci TaxID=1209068 RepID=A0AAV9SXN7_9PEZI
MPAHAHPHPPVFGFHLLTLVAVPFPKLSPECQESRSRETDRRRCWLASCYMSTTRSKAEAESELELELERDVWPREQCQTLPHSRLLLLLLLHAGGSSATAYRPTSYRKQRHCRSAKRPLGL